MATRSKHTISLMGGLVAFALGVTAGCVFVVVDQVDCGVNAYDYGGSCACFAGYDGDPYTECEPLLDLLLTDLCDDGLDVEWRVFAEERDWVWPEGGNVFVTTGYEVDNYQTIQCHEGESLCFGAASGEQSWGLGIEGDLDCDDCCFDCGAYEFDLGYLTCG